MKYESNYDKVFEYFKLNATTTGKPITKKDLAVLRITDGGLRHALTGLKHKGLITQTVTKRGYIWVG